MIIRATLLDENTTECVMIELQGELKSNKDVLDGLDIGNLEISEEVN